MQAAERLTGRHQPPDLVVGEETIHGLLMRVEAWMLAFVDIAPWGRETNTAICCLYSHS
jgi:hypothetical protein